jgi:hypothetical protein
MDKIEKIDRSLVQHGKENDRLYLIKMDHTDYPEIITKVDAFSQEKSYGKIFAKVPTWAVQAFHQHRFIKEAFIPRFFRGHTAPISCPSISKKRDARLPRMNDNRSPRSFGSPVPKCKPIPTCRL